MLCRITWSLSPCAIHLVCGTHPACIRSCVENPPLTCFCYYLPFRYGPERYMYKEGMKLAAKYAEEEKALAEELKVGAAGCALSPSMLAVPSSLALLGAPLGLNSTWVIAAPCFIPMLVLSFALRPPPLPPLIPILPSPGSVRRRRRREDLPGPAAHARADAAGPAEGGCLTQRRVCRGQAVRRQPLLAVRSDQDAAV